MRDFNDNSEVRQDKHIVIRLLSYLKPYTWKFIGSFLLMIVTTFANMVLPLASGLAVDLMAKPESEMPLETKMLILGIGAAVLLIIMMASVVIGFYQNMMLQHIGQQVTHDMRIEVFKHIENLSIGQINQLPVGKLVTRATNDPGNISDMFTNSLVNLIRSVMMILIIAIILFVINWQMALITMTTMPVIFVASYLFRKYSRKAYRQVRNNVSEVNAFLSENLSGMKITQVFNQEEKKFNEFKNINNNLKKSYLKEIVTFSVYRPVIWCLAMVGTLLAIYFGISAVLAGSLSVGMFISFYVYVGQFFDPIQNIADQFNSLQNGFSSAEKIFDVLDTKPDIIDLEDAIELTSFSGHIEFRDVWFQYIPDEWVLKGISFKVKPDETVAFVGATGSGKTTILQLIVRNYDIQQGQILIDGIDIKKIKRSSLRSFVGQMLQDVFLFSGTIRDNITLHDESISEEKVVEASNYVGLNHVLNKLPDGLNHMVRERGNNFSSGERQLIS